MKRHHELFQVTQAAILVNPERRMLILRLPNGEWILPGGRLHKGEVWEDGFRREVAEETGIRDLSIRSIVHVTNRYHVMHAVYAVVFLCFTEARMVTLSPEHLAFAWIGRNDRISMYVFVDPTLKRIVREAVRTYL
ncbi:MAG: NUDIX domain-containing protein [Parcubacteria group bacterium]|nr:NUDIX domain-containing protein [Parcubacteria group bacterium]